VRIPGIVVEHRHCTRADPTSVDMVCYLSGRWIVPNQWVHGLPVRFLDLCEERAMTMHRLICSLEMICLSKSLESMLLGVIAEVAYALEEKCELWHLASTQDCLTINGSYCMGVPQGSQVTIDNLADCIRRA
jgi:hypothetical protein